MPGRTYNDEEVREILRRAAEQSSGSEPSTGGLTREELVDAARDAGIDPAAVQDAMIAVEAEREVQSEMALLRAEDRKRLAARLAGTAIVAAVAFASAPGGDWWPLWILGFMAILLFLRLSQREASVRRRAERSIELRRGQKRVGRHIDHRRNLDAEHVERGVEELLEAAARRSDERSAPRVRAPDDSEEGASTAGASDTDRAAEPSVRGRSRS
jgi:hypothetical protein